jgi:hypothetical protein
MTINTRNKIILVGISVTALLFAGFLAAAIIIFKHAPSSPANLRGGFGITAVLVSLLSELLYAAAAIIILYFSFKNTTCPEIFFFIIFLVTMSFDSLKACFALFEIINFPPYYRAIITRTVYFGRFLGTLVILASGLFSLGAEYQRMEIFLGVAFLLAFSLSAAVPIDITETEANLLFKLGNAKELGIISLLFLMFGVFNYVLFAIQNSSRDHAMIAAGLSLVIAGREILFFISNPIALIAAFLMLIVGTTLFGERTHAVHLWS